MKTRDRRERFLENFFVRTCARVEGRRHDGERLERAMEREWKATRETEYRVIRNSWYNRQVADT